MSSLTAASDKKIYCDIPALWLLMGLAMSTSTGALNALSLLLILLSLPHWNFKAKNQQRSIFLVVGFLSLAVFLSGKGIGLSHINETPWQFLVFMPAFLISGKSIRWAIIGLAIGITVTAGYAILQSYFGDHFQLNWADIFKYRSRGVGFFGAVTTAQVFYFAILFFWYILPKKNRYRLFLVLFTTWAMIETESRASIGALFLFFSYRMLPKKSLKTIALVLSITGLLTLFFMTHDFDVVSITDRFKMWAVAWDQFLAHPWFGLGADQFRHLSADLYVPPVPPLRSHAHSMIFDTLATKGIIGILMLVLFWWQAMKWNKNLLVLGWFFNLTLLSLVDCNLMDNEVMLVYFTLLGWVFNQRFSSSGFILPPTFQHKDSSSLQT